MINPNKFVRSPFPRWQAQWMMAGKISTTPPAGGLVDGDPVTTWPDSSGNGHAATQTGSARPTFKTAIVSGKPVVRFSSASSSVLNLTSINGADPFLIFAVGKHAAVGGTFHTLSGDAAGYPGLVEGGGVLYGLNRTGYNAYPPPSDTAFHVFAVVSSGATTLDIDGATIGLSSSGAVPNSGNFVRIGEPTTNCDVAEIILYTSGPTGGDIHNIEKGLCNKYGITYTGPAATAVLPDTVSGLVGWWKADALL